MFLDETPFIGNYVYPHPSRAYFTPYLASQVGFLSCEEGDDSPIALPFQMEDNASLCCRSRCLHAVPLLENEVAYRDCRLQSQAGPLIKVVLQRTTCAEGHPRHHQF